MSPTHKAKANTWSFLKGLLLDNLKEHLNEWEVRVMVLVSLLFQILLILFGNRRKHTAKTWLQFMLWFTYLSADWVATVALGVLSKDSTGARKDSNKCHSHGGDKSLDPTYVIMASWAPFLLVHLGGPDTITAYSLEDNELWPRHLVGLVVQVVVAGYVFVRSWVHDKLNFLTIPMFVAGLIKYGERTWSLRYGSRKQFRDAIIPPPDPGPNYAKFMDEYGGKKAEGYKVCVGEVIETTPILLEHSQSSDRNDRDATTLQDGFYFFRIFKRLFADLILSFEDHGNSQIFFRKISWDTAFRVTEIELGLMYDLLYTKAVLTYSRLGIILKALSFSSTLSAFISFCCLIYHNDNKYSIYHDDNECPIYHDKKYSQIDKNISLVLFMGAVVLEIYAVIGLLCSDWAMYWLSSKHKNWGVNFLYRSISCFQTCFKLSHTRRWSNRMSQFNFINFCLKDKPVKCINRIQKLLLIYDELEHYRHSEIVPRKLRKLIFGQVKKKSREASDFEACKRLCAQRGDQVLRDWNFHSIGWSIEQVEFDQSILLWHIATDLCCYEDEANNPGFTHPYCTVSKLLSNYLLYLLVLRPFMLPNGIGQIRFKDSCAEATEFFQERKYKLSRKEACEILLRVDTEILPSLVKGDRSKSVLFDACRLAKSLQSLERTPENWSKKRKWKMISHVWVEMLSHAASQCSSRYHAMQLSQGGELLTHVWLLMAHLGITEQFQISHGHARAKLLVS